MANKAISELPQAQNVNNQDLFVLEQSGIAKKLTAETFITEQGIIDALAEALDGHGGISSVTLSSVSGRIRTYLITFTDETTTTFQVYDGTSIDRIVKTSTAGLTDTYTVFMNDGSTTFFQVTNGSKGDTGYPTDEQVATAVNTWLDNNVTPGTGAVLDRTLTMSNAAAPADLVGDLKSSITEKLTLKQPINLCRSDSDWTTGAYVDNGSGAITSSSGLSYSAKMPVNVGDVIRLYDLYGGTFANRQIRSVAAYDANDTFVRTSDSLGWKVNSYTVPEGVAYIILSAPTASNYMVVANTTVTAYEAWFEPYYIATYDFVSNALENSELSTDNLKNGYACALPKTKFRQTVGIPCIWYKSSMITPQSAEVYVNAGYSRTTNDVNTFSWNTGSADSTNNGFLWYVYDTLMNLLYKFDNNTGYGAATVTKALNLSDCSLLAIGDSTVDQDHMTGKLLSYFAEHGHTITLLGTLGSQSDPLNRNEGRAGWTTADYMANTTKNGYTNPFYNATTESFDFSYYMTQQGYSGVDFVVIQLGINDLYPSTPRYTAVPNYSAIWGNIQTMIDSILAYNSGIKIIINLPTTPNSDPTAHRIAPFLYLNYVINYNNYALDRILSLSESKVRASYCHLILDPTNDINDNVHPKVAGYNKMALEVVNQINCWQNGV